MSPEQSAAVEHISEKLEGESRKTFNALAVHYPKPRLQKELAELLCSDYATKPLTCCSRIGVRLNDLRGWLDDFYDGPEAKGKGLLWRVTMPHGKGYVLEFAPHSSFYLRRFWRPHMQDRPTVQEALTYRAQIQTLISFTELRFFRDDLKRIFFRHQDINDDTSSAEINELTRDMPLLAAMIGELGVRPTNFFTTTGEMSCVLMLTKMFEQHQIPNQYSPQHKMPVEVSQYSKDENLLLIGNKRTHPLVRSIQKDGFYTEGWRWRIADRGIEPVAGGDSYNDLDVIDGRRLVYALVARMPSRWRGRVVTILAGNHGRAFEGLAEVLTSEDRLCSLLKEDLSWPDEEPLPERFQILFSVQINDIDEMLQTGAAVVDYSSSLKRAKHGSTHPQGRSSRE